MILPFLRSMKKRIIGNENENANAVKTDNNILLGSVSYLKANKIKRINANEGGTNRVEIILAIKCLSYFSISQATYWGFNSSCK